MSGARHHAAPAPHRIIPDPRRFRMCGGCGRVVREHHLFNAAESGGRQRCDFCRASERSARAYGVGRDVRFDRGDRVGITEQACPHLP